MAPFLELLSFGFSLWMFVDALRRKADFYWYVLIILLMPIGGFIYFFVIKLPEMQAASADGTSLGTGTIPFPMRKGTTVRTLEAQVVETPSQQNRLALAWALFEDRRIQESSQIFKACHIEDQDDAESVYGIARCLSAQDNFKEAIAHYQRVITIDRVFRDYDPWLDLAAAHTQAGDPEKTIELLKKLVQEAPRVKHKTILGRCFSDQNRVDDARRVLTEALSDFEESSFFLQRDNESWVSQARSLLAGLPTQLH